MYEIVWHSRWGEEVIDQAISLKLARELKFEYEMAFGGEGYITWRYKPREKGDEDKEARNERYAQPPTRPAYTLDGDGR